MLSFSIPSLTNNAQLKFICSLANNAQLKYSVSQQTMLSFSFPSLANNAQLKYLVSQQTMISFIFFFIKQCSVLFFYSSANNAQL